jgi:hypothetical protein
VMICGRWRPQGKRRFHARGRRTLDASLAGLLIVGGLVPGCADGMAVGPLLISGVVVDAAGQPVGDARVAFTATPVEVPDIAALTGDDGRFSLAVPVAGVYRVAAIGDQGRAEETVDVALGQPKHVRLVLQP